MCDPENFSIIDGILNGKVVSKTLRSPPLPLHPPNFGSLHKSCNAPRGYRTLTVWGSIYIDSAWLSMKHVSAKNSRFSSATRTSSLEACKLIFQTLLYSIEPTLISRSHGTQRQMVPRRRSALTRGPDAVNAPGNGSKKQEPLWIRALDLLSPTIERRRQKR